MRSSATIRFVRVLTSACDVEAAEYRRGSRNEAIAGYGEEYGMCELRMSLLW
jgi:hypothetical protein